MRTTRAHVSITKVLAAAGVNLSTTWEKGIISLKMSEAEEMSWMEDRKKSLARLRNRKSYRRGLNNCECDQSIAEEDEESTEAPASANFDALTFDLRSNDSHETQGRATPRANSSANDEDTVKHRYRDFDSTGDVRIADVPSDIYDVSTEESFPNYSY